MERAKKPVHPFSGVAMLRIVAALLILSCAVPLVARPSGGPPFIVAESVLSSARVVSSAGARATFAVVYRVPSSVYVRFLTLDGRVLGEDWMDGETAVVESDGDGFLLAVVAGFEVRAVRYSAEGMRLDPGHLRLGTADHRSKVDVVAAGPDRYRLAWNYQNTLFSLLISNGRPDPLDYSFQLRDPEDLEVTFHPPTGSWVVAATKIEYRNWYSVKVLDLYVVDSLGESHVLDTLDLGYAYNTRPTIAVSSDGMILVAVSDRVLGYRLGYRRFEPLWSLPLGAPLCEASMAGYGRETLLFGRTCAGQQLVLRALDGGGWTGAPATLHDSLAPVGIGTFASFGRAGVVYVRDGGSRDIYAWLMPSLLRRGSPRP